MRDCSFQWQSSTGDIWFWSKKCIFLAAFLWIAISCRPSASKTLAPGMDGIKRPWCFKLTPVIVTELVVIGSSRTFTAFRCTPSDFLENASVLNAWGRSLRVLQSEREKCSFRTFFLWVRFAEWNVKFAFSDFLTAQFLEKWANSLAQACRDVSNRVIWWWFWYSPHFFRIPMTQQRQPTQ